MTSKGVLWTGIFQRMLPQQTKKIAVGKAGSSLWMEDYCQKGKKSRNSKYKTTVNRVRSRDSQQYVMPGQLIEEKLLSIVDCQISIVPYQISNDPASFSVSFPCSLQSSTIFRFISSESKCITSPVKIIKLQGCCADVFDSAPDTPCYEDFHANAVFFPIFRTATYAIFV